MRWTSSPNSPSIYRQKGCSLSDDPGDFGFEPLSESEAVEVDADCRKQAWARLLAKVYEVDPLVCPKCGSGMKVVAVIHETEEIRRILAHPGRMAEQHAKRATRLLKDQSGATGI